ncbi:glycoside hydrolase [Fulvivirga sp. M361]|uniref:isoamylase early set domain-containing protein n=1 Tax=Fulvivirga sp. M361 TaxID=2594266 RepID=UPI00117A7B30|nr:isoamylase early set domain-containing protein [Fulvivirga sp. M361]TRX60205.1 glycoside hydrolase [Fulvivirga sp. M361]
MGIKKQYLKSRDICKVTLTLPKEQAKTAKKVMLVGDFNGWDVEATPMQKLKNGSFKTNLSLTKGNEYQFRYLLDSNRWENELEADKYVSNGYSGDNNSVVII